MCTIYSSLIYFIQHVWNSSVSMLHFSGLRLNVTTVGGSLLLNISLCIPTNKIRKMVAMLWFPF